MRVARLCRTLPIALLLIGISACAPLTRTVGQPQQAPNRVQAGERLLTSGQPAMTELRALQPGQFAMVIDLAPREHGLSSADEARILAARRIAYIAIPVDLEQPREMDFELFSASLNAAHQPVWIHCQRNQRASMFVFLYRVIELHAEPEEAYEKVTEVWVPTAEWVRFANRILSRRQIAFRL